MSEFKYCDYCYPNCKGHRTVKTYYFSTFDIYESDHTPFEWDIINYYLNKKMHESWELVYFEIDDDSFHVFTIVKDSTGQEYNVIAKPGNNNINRVYLISIEGKV